VLDGVRSSEPQVEVLHDAAGLPGLTVTPMPGTRGRWALRLPIPASVLNDGVQTFLVRDIASGEDIAAFTILTGEAAGADVRAELDLLRAELDMLKAAFRRHCQDTGG
jgi:hypothetical protein